MIIMHHQPKQIQWKHTVVYWVWFETIKLKQMTIDRNVANKMKRFLHTA